MLRPKVDVERIVWVSHFTSEGSICISKDAFGENYPFQDLYVSPDHCMSIHGKMVRAKYLVNDTIYKEAGECAKHSHCGKWCIIGNVRGFRQSAYV